MEKPSSFSCDAVEPREGMLGMVIPGEPDIRVPYDPVPSLHRIVVGSFVRKGAAVDGFIIVEKLSPANPLLLSRRDDNSPTSYSSALLDAMVHAGRADEAIEE